MAAPTDPSTGTVVHKGRRHFESQVCCDHRERRTLRLATVPGSKPNGIALRARLFEVVAETSNGEFSWHENTTLLLPFSGAVDAGAEAPITVCQVCPISPAGCSRRWQGATRAGRAASTLTRGSGRNDYRIQYGENSRELSAKMRWAALHGGRCGGWCWCSSRNGFKVRRQI